jgi:hypothetical protein
VYRFQHINEVIYILTTFKFEIVQWAVDKRHGQEDCEVTILAVRQNPFNLKHIHEESSALTASGVGPGFQTLRNAVAVEEKPRVCTCLCDELGRRLR